MTNVNCKFVIDERTDGTYTGTIYAFDNSVLVESQPLSRMDVVRWLCVMMDQSVDDYDTMKLEVAA